MYLSSSHTVLGFLDVQLLITGTHVVLRLRTDVKSFSRRDNCMKAGKLITGKCCNVVFEAKDSMIHE